AAMLLSVVCYPVVVLAASGDFTIQMRNEDGQTRTQYVSSHAVRSVASFPVETDVIYRLDENKIIWIDNKAKTYTEATLAELQAASQRSPAGQEVPERFKAMMTPPSVTREGAGETILGYSTEKYAIKSPLVQGETWVTTALKWPAGFRELVLASLPGPMKGS